MPQPISAPALAIDWLLRETGSLADPADLLPALCGRLAEMGLPLWRATFPLPPLHPPLRGAVARWGPDTGTVETRPITRRLPPLPALHPHPPGQPPRTGTAVHPPPAQR